VRPGGAAPIEEIDAPERGRGEARADVGERGAAMQQDLIPAQPTAAPQDSAQPAVDLAAVKQRQQAMWATGDFSVIGGRHVIVSELLCEAADVRTGWRVLDVACGHGNTALAAARRGAVTTGLDFVPALLERARERAAAERLQVDWREGDAEALPFDDGAFDAVLSTFGVMFAPDQARAARELVRVCRPGGCIGLACWTPTGYAGEMFGTVARFRPPPPGMKPPMTWGTREGLEALLGDGVSELRIEPRVFTLRFASAEHWLEVFRNWFGPVRTALEGLDESRRQELSGELIALVRRYDRSGGASLVAPMDYFEIVAKRR
jgi:ubiquinone/menaquinone biosynthesis C-methylase UbiE